MLINYTKVVEALSISLDYVEQELLNVTPYHGSRVAAVSYKMGLAAGMDPDELFALIQAALLHDCALKEYLKDMADGDSIELNESRMITHCIVGERAVRRLPFYDVVEGTVLYHHERADGQGSFGKKPEDIPLSARILHFADLLDLRWRLGSINVERYAQALAWSRENEGTLFDAEVAEFFRRNVDMAFLKSLSGLGAFDYIRAVSDRTMIDIPLDTLIVIADCFAFITDYKSKFTRNHSLGIADKARRMAMWYGYDAQLCDKLYIAGALHDIGKLMVTNDILEKPGRLTPEEYRRIQDHAMGTHVLLDRVEGLEEIAHWAANHHEKLNGKGYPYGLTGESLDKNDRMMACLDIYQALVESRPYKEGMSHGKAMEILNRCVENGELDGDIVRDIDACFGSATP